MVVIGDGHRKGHQHQYPCGQQCGSHDQQVALLEFDSFVHLSSALQNSALVWSDLNSDGTMTPSGFYAFQFWNMRIGWIHLMLRFSDKNQKAIDLLRTKCLKLKCMVSLNTVCHMYTAIKASEMLVAPRISECFGLPWSALVCYSLPWSAIVCLGLL